MIKRQLVLQHDKNMTTPHAFISDLIDPATKQFTN